MGAVDITGDRFGKLTAMRPTEERGDHRGVIWVCKCDCGRSFRAECGYLRAGFFKSCGCIMFAPAPRGRGFMEAQKESRRKGWRNKFIAKQNITKAKALLERMGL